MSVREIATVSLLALAACAGGGVDVPQLELDSAEPALDTWHLHSTAALPALPALPREPAPAVLAIRVAIAARPAEPASVIAPAATEPAAESAVTEPPAAEAAIDPPAARVVAATLDPPRVRHHLAADSPRLRRYGVMMDVGAPDGATASLVVRPIRAVRLDGGISYNGVSNGVRAGITLVPFASWFTPTLSLDVGHYGEGDANPLARLVTGDPTYSSPALDRVGYDYGDAQLGLELGRKRFTFYLRAGVTRVTGSVHDLAAVIGGPMKPIITLEDPMLTITAVSARLGFVLYFGG